MGSLSAYRSPLHDQPPAPGAALLPANTQPAVKRIVFVLVDALRVDTSRDPAVMPFLDELRGQGAWATMRSRPLSYSIPSYSVLFTGAWPDLSDGPAINLEYEDIPAWTQDNLFSAAARAGLKTAVSGYHWFEKLIPQAAVSASFYTPGEDQLADRQVVDASLPWLRSGGYPFVLIHLDQVDYAGHHEGGPRDPRWDEAANRADHLLAEITAELDLSVDALVVVSDHGQIDRGGHGGHEAVVLSEPFVIVGAGVRPGFYGEIDMVDVAPTLAVLLGMNIPASSQGHVRSEMLDLPQQVVAALPEALQIQQNRLLSAYQSAIGSYAAVEPGEDAVDLYQSALQRSRLRRLNGERLARLLPALLAALLPLAWFWRRRRFELGWYLGAGLLYLAIFNLRYAVLERRTYSLSSAASPDDLILFCASTATLALLLSWLFAFVGRRVFRQASGAAALWTLDLSLGVIYLLSLPLLWSFVWNGLLVTWTLPDFPSLFLGFLVLIQILVVSVAALLLPGLAALAARFHI